MNRVHGQKGGQHESQGFRSCFQFLCEHGSDLAFALRGRTVVAMSSSCRNLLGWEPAELVKRSLRELLTSETWSTAAQTLRRCRVGEDGGGTLWSWRHKFGEATPLRTWCLSVPPGSPWDTIGLACPLPAGSPADQSALPERVLLPGVAHELKQPLTAISNYVQACAQLLLSGATDTATLSETLGLVLEQAHRAGDILDSMRRLSTTGKLRRVPVSINELLREQWRIMAADVEKAGVEVAWELDEKLPPVSLDRVQIGQVINNLLRNALEAMETTREGAGKLVLTSRRQDAEIEVAIRDTGKGLSPEQAAKLFEPFHTTKPHGMGLGLALSQAIVQAHGGRMWVSPHTNQGITIYFALPTQA